MIMKIAVDSNNKNKNKNGFYKSYTKYVIISFILML